MFRQSPRLVDLVHAFEGVVVEQFKKRLEKLLSHSTLLWRLLKLLFKVLQWVEKTKCKLSFTSTSRKNDHFFSKVKTSILLNMSVGILEMFFFSKKCVSSKKQSFHSTGERNTQASQVKEYPTSNFQFIEIGFICGKNLFLVPIFNQAEKWSHVQNFAIIYIH